MARTGEREGLSAAQVLATRIRNVEAGVVVRVGTSKQIVTPPSSSTSRLNP